MYKKEKDEMEGLCGERNHREINFIVKERICQQFLLSYFGVLYERVRSSVERGVRPEFLEETR